MSVGVYSTLFTSRMQTLLLLPCYAVLLGAFDLKRRCAEWSVTLLPTLARQISNCSFKNKPNIFFDDLLSSILFINNYL